MSGGAKLAFTAVDDGAGFVTDGDDPPSDVLAISGLVAWFQSDEAFVTLSGGGVTSMANLAAVETYMKNVYGLAIPD